jgi:hypothetical protein
MTGETPYYNVIMDMEIKFVLSPINEMEISIR